MPKRLWSPRYWLLWLGIFFLRLLVLLPYRSQLCIGRCLGALLYYVMPKRRHIAATNINLCFPEKSTQARQQLLKSSFKSFGMGIMEALMAWWMSERRFNKIPFIWKGKERYEEIRARGQGLIALGGHFTCLEIAGRCFGSNIPVGLTYKASHHPLFEYILTQGRLRYMKFLIKHTQLKAMAQKLREGNILWYAPDQDFGIARSVRTSFFGVSTATITGVSVLAKLGKALVVPVYFHRLPKGGYEAFSLEPLDNFPSDDPEQDAARWQGLLESFIRKYPEDYLWLHRRFKTQEPGVKSFY